MISIFSKDKKPKKNQVSIPKLTRNNDWVSSDPVLLEIPIEGNIYCNDQVVVDGDGQLKGNIYSKSCVVSGNINGDINCSEFIELKNQAVICGNIKTGAIKIEPGSVVNGFISIDNEIKLPAFPANVEDNLITDTGDSGKRPDDANPMFSVTSKASQLSVDQAQLTVPVSNKKTGFFSESSKSSGIAEIKPAENSGSWW